MCDLKYINFYFRLVEARAFNMFNGLSRILWGLGTGALFGFLMPYLFSLYFEAFNIGFVKLNLQSYFIKFHEYLFYPALYAVLSCWVWLIIRLTFYHCRGVPTYTKDSFYGLQGFYPDKASFSPIIAPIMMIPFLTILVSHLSLPLQDLSVKTHATMYGGTLHSGGWTEALQNSTEWVGLAFIILWSFVFHFIVRTSNEERQTVLAFSAYFSFAAAHVYLVTLFYDSFFWFYS